MCIHCLGDTKAGSCKQHIDNNHEHHRWAKLLSIFIIDNSNVVMSSLGSNPHIAYSYTIHELPNPFQAKQTKIEEKHQQKMRFSFDGQ